MASDGRTQPDDDARGVGRSRLVAAGALVTGIALIAYGALSLVADPAPTGAGEARASPSASAAASPSRTLELAWPARVRRAEGASLAVGATCTVRARIAIGGGEASGAAVDVLCGDDAVYRSSAIPAYLRPAFRLDEQPGPREGSFRYALTYADQTSDTDEHPRLRLETIARVATVERAGSPTFRVSLAVDELSEPADGEPIDRRARGAPFREPLVYHGRVVASDAPDAGIAVGAPCVVALRPAYEAREWNCRARVECAGEVLYGTGASGFARCASDAGAPLSASDPSDSTRDGDPELDLDLRAGSVRVRDRGPSPFDVVVALDGAAP